MFELGGVWSSFVRASDFKLSSGRVRERYWAIWPYLESFALSPLVSYCRQPLLWILASWIRKTPTQPPWDLPFASYWRSPPMVLVQVIRALTNPTVNKPFTGAALATQEKNKEFEPRLRGSSRSPHRYFEPGDHLVILLEGHSSPNHFDITSLAWLSGSFSVFPFSGSSLVGVLPYTLPSFLREHSVAR